MYVYPKGKTSGLREDISSDIVNAILRAYGDKVVEIILYGSVARGDATAESDIDIAVIMTEERSKEEHADIISEISDLELEYDVVISVVSLVKSLFDKWVDILPYYSNIRKEGFVLWSSITG